MRRSESRHLRVPSSRALSSLARHARRSSSSQVRMPLLPSLAIWQRIWGRDRVLMFPERSDTPFSPKTPDARKVARRMEAAFSLACGRPRVVVASARALIRMMPPKDSLVAAPLVFEAGVELADTAREGEAALPSAMRERCCVETFEDVARALEDRGYANTGELDGPGTFAVHGGTIDVFPGNLTYPVRIDLFGDEVDRDQAHRPLDGADHLPAFARRDIPGARILLLSGDDCPRAQEDRRHPRNRTRFCATCLRSSMAGFASRAPTRCSRIFDDKPVTLGAWAGPDTMTCLIEPRSLFDDATHAYEEIEARAKGTKIPAAGLYAGPTALDFGRGVRATYVSIMRVGGTIDVELPVKRVEVGRASRQAVRSLGEPRRRGQHGGPLRAGATRAPRHRARARR